MENKSKLINHENLSLYLLWSKCRLYGDAINIDPTTISCQPIFLLTVTTNTKSNIPPNPVYQYAFTLSPQREDDNDCPRNLDKLP